MRVPVSGARGSDGARSHRIPMAEKLSAVKGMNDIAPPVSAHWEWLEDKLRSLMLRYGYRNLRTPIVEPTALFVRGLGEVTDIVEKEMYSLKSTAWASRPSVRRTARR